MSVAGYIISPSWASPSLQAFPVPPVLASALTVGAPRTWSAWVRPTGALSAFSPFTYARLSTFRVGIGFGVPGSPTVRVVIIDDAGQQRVWDQAVPSELFSTGEYRHLLVSYSTASVRVWVEGVEVPMTATGAGSNIVQAEGFDHLAFAPGSFVGAFWDEIALVSGNVVDPAVFRAGPALARNLAAVPGLLYWLRTETANNFADSGPNGITFDVAGRSVPNNDLLWEAGVALEAAPVVDPLLVAAGPRSRGHAASCAVQGATGALVRTDGVAACAREAAGTYRLTFGRGTSRGWALHHLHLAPVAPSARVLVAEALVDGVRVRAFDADGNPRDTSFLAAWSRVA